TAESVASERGWRFRRTNPSLPEVYRSVQVPKTGRGWLGILRKLLAFSGPGYLVAVGYMDPGNWATDLAGGSQFYYTLLSVVIISSLMAIFLQQMVAVTITAGMMASSRVINRRKTGGRRMRRKPSITTWPASVPVSVEFWPEASRATAKSVLAAPTPRRGLRSL